MCQGVDARRRGHRWREVEREQRVVNNNFRSNLDIRDGGLMGRTISLVPRDTAEGRRRRTSVGRGNGDDGNERLIRGKGSSSRSTAAPLLQCKSDGLGYTYSASPAEADSRVDLLLLSQIRGFLYLKIGDMRLNMLVARGQAVP